MAIPRPLNPGELRNQVQITRKDASLNAYNEEVVTWPVFASVWAKIDHLRGREYLDARQATADLTTKITIRYLQGMLPSMRVEFGDQVYEVISVIDVQERHNVMELMCKQTSGAGVSG